MDQLSVGYSRHPITPAWPVPLNGYGNNQNRMYQRVLDDIYVTCMAFREGEETLLWITQDLLNTEPTTYGIFKMVSEATGVEKNRIMVCSSHNHSGPDTDMPGHEAIAKYLPFYYETVVKTARDALADLKPAELYGASTHLPGMNFVRHYIMNDGTYFGPNFGSLASGYKCHAAENDDELRLLKIARTGGKDILLMNWGAHLTMTGGVAKYDLSADYIGATRTMIERDADMLFAFVQCAGGNQVPDSWIASERHKLTYIEYGEKLARVAMDLLPAMKKIEGKGIASIRVDMDCAVNHDGAELIEEARQVNALYMAGESRDVCNAKAHELGLTSQYHARAIVARQTRPERGLLRLDAVQIGGMAFVTTPYEMFSDHSRYIKANSPFAMTMIATCANGDAVYIPTAEAYDYGCYESYVSYFAKGSGELAADKLVEMLKSLK